MIPWWIRIIFLLVSVLLIWLVLKIPDNCIAWIVLIFLIIFLVPVLAFILFTPKLRRLIKKKFFRRITGMLKFLLPSRHDVLERYANFILHSYNTVASTVKEQVEIFNEMGSYYPDTTKFIALTMDMDYMINCDKPQAGSVYLSQLEDLKIVKENGLYSNKIYPFIHADPRRFVDGKQEQDYYKILEDHIETKTFQGIKLYPALGYFPFDRRLKKVYDLAIKYNLPITTHCSKGPVFYRGKIKTLRNDGYFEDGKFIHPFTGNELQGKSPKDFTPHFTHPLNYYCLMNEPEKLYEYWQRCEQVNPSWSMLKEEGEYTADDLKKYKSLKICLGHYGGSEEWLKYLRDPWLPTQKNTLEINNSLVHEPRGKWKYKADGEELKDIQPHSWHSIISDMLKHEDENKNQTFPNLYADISYNLSEEDILPLLKVRLETNQTLARKVLFGTDFYMVSMEATERELTMKLRAFIGEKNFKQIAVLNPLEFISSGKTEKIDLLEV
jgi:predicted TIM-barrel fold metal-dependent hydrolase